MGWLNVVLVLYSLLNIGLAIYGYQQGSQVSLIAGLAIGVLMLGSVALSMTHPRWGRIFSLVLALAVTGRFLPLFLKTKDWLPAGVLTVASVIVIVCLLGGHLFANRDRSATPDAR